MTLEQLFNKVDELISEELRVELRAQGHYNTGALENSIKGKVKKNKLEGTSAYYALILHHGFGPEKASFKQAPFLEKYFLSKGHSPKDAKSFAFATIKVWMKEGMPSSGSFAYSETGARTQVISIVKKAINGKVNQTMSAGLDKIVNNKFHETKSETI